MLMKRIATKEQYTDVLSMLEIFTDRYEIIIDVKQGEINERLQEGY